MKTLPTTSTLPGFPAAERAGEASESAALLTAFSTRAERAVALFRMGAVEPLGNGRYKVRAGNGGYWAVRDGYCNCPDFAWRGAVPCKHLIAVELARPGLAAAAA